MIEAHYPSMPLHMNFSEGPLSTAMAMTNPASKAVMPLLFATGASVVAYAGICAALYRYQEKLIFRPLPDLIHSPAEAGLAYEDVWIPAGPEGQGKLHGWWIPCPGSQQVMLFCHGNYGNISFNLSRIRFYHALGFSVLAFDYRGYGQSMDADEANWAASTPTEKSTYADVEVAWAYLTEIRQISPKQITVCGHSMGGAIAINLAIKHPEMARLIIKSSFTTMKDAVDAKRIYRLFPVKQLLKHPFDSLSKVKSLQVPVLYIHGAQDFDVPVRMSRQLLAATKSRKQLWIAPDADHNNICELHGQTLGTVIESFCTESELIYS
ncbi:MAG: alpha/beta fold hydrolase [Cyanobacteria bacterium J06621_3]